MCRNGDFTVEDLADLVFPPEMGVTGYLRMVYQCFLDDSKDQNQSKLMVSVGFFGTKEDWGSLRIAWKKRLDQDGLRYFKTSEYKMLEGEFAKFKTAEYPPPTGREKARQIRSDLQEIVRRHPLIRGIGISILLEEYAKVYARPEAKGVLPSDPYQAALISVMHQTVKIIQARRRHMVAFVHDESADFEVLRSAYLKFKEANPRTARFMGGFAPLDDKFHPPLQAADMVANYTLGLGLEGLAVGNMKANVTEMKQNIHLLGFWDEGYILAVLKRNLASQGKPIAVDLQSEQYD